MKEKRNKTEIIAVFFKRTYFKFSIAFSRAVVAVNKYTSRFRRRHRKFLRHNNSLLSNE